MLKNPVSEPPRPRAYNMQRFEFGHKFSGRSINTEDTRQIWFFKFYLKVKLRLFKPNFRAFEIPHFALVYIVVIPQNKNKKY